MTTQNTYLHIAGFEAYTGSAPMRMRRGGTTTSTSRTRRGTPRMIPMGGMGGMMGGHFRRGKSFSMSFTMGNSKVSLN